MSDDLVEEPMDYTPIGAEDRRRLRIARLVAESWRDTAIGWGSLQMDGRATAHPLALVLCALDGETDPVELGISPTDPAWDAIKAAARSPEQSSDHAASETAPLHGTQRDDG